MRTNFECIPCMINGVMSLFKNGLIEEKYQEEIIRKALKYYSEMDLKDPPLLVTRNFHKLIRELSNNPDPYKPVKDQFNQTALKYYDKYKAQLSEIDDPFDLAMRLAIAGNIIDFGPGHAFDVDKTINTVLNCPFAIDDSQELRQNIKEAKNILYLGDNTGEIVFDKLFLEVINRPDITYVVRNSPILNDATMEDVKNLGIDKMVNVMTNGDNSPGTLIDYVSDEFRKKFYQADLIISKGQGNFEGLHGIEDRNIFFLLMLKCDIIGKMLGQKKGDYVVKSALKKSKTAAIG